MTTAFITRYSSSMECEYTLIIENIPKDFVPSHPSNHSGSGLAVSDYVFADALMMGDIYVTQDSKTIRLTINHKNGLQVDFSANKETKEVGYLIRDPQKDIDMDMELPEEDVEAILVMLNAVSE